MKQMPFLSAMLVLHRSSNLLLEKSVSKPSMYHCPGTWHSILQRNKDHPSTDNWL